MTKKSRTTRGGAIDLVLASFRPAGFPPLSPPPPPDAVFRADRFTMAPGEGWKDETVYMIAAPDESRFRRNLVIRRDPLEEAPASLEEFVRAEADEMATTIPGFDLLEEGAAAVKDGGPARRLVFRRRTREGGLVRQSQVIASRGTDLYWTCLTTEEAMPEEERRKIEAILSSLAVGPKGGAAAPRGKA